MMARMRMRAAGWSVWWMLVAGFWWMAGMASADETAAGWVSRVVSVQGSVLALRQGEAAWRPVVLNETFAAGDRIRVGADSRAGLVLSNDAVLRLDQNTTLVFTAIEARKTFIFRLLEGAANFFSHRPRSLKILTPFVNGTVEGTEFYVRVDDRQTRIELFEGRIMAVNDAGELPMASGEGCLAAAGSAPRRTILVRPRDSVQWALYYPPVMIPGIVGEGLPERPDAAFYIHRAGRRLHVGRAVEARDDLGRALAVDPQNADALALEAVVAVVQNRNDEAIDLARQAVARDDRSAAAHISLSYALQAGFRLDEALAAAGKAVRQAPDSALAQARLAELHLCMGALDDGVSADRRAAEIDPNLGHAQTVLGFAHLARMDTGRARQAFDRAIAMDSAAPLPRLGRGLALIRDGDLGAGRSEIEIAVSLDPANALMRSYLGKAYFDEKRGPLDGQQLDIAKDLDPRDPTPWFYDAIRKQTRNRPGEALGDLQRSIALNDNRAVYRSRLMLDQDLAARNAALGRIYNDLSFETQAAREGAASLRADPTNFSAHRLLADIYAGRQRHEIARVSELLQSQLLQPLNLSPVQPQTAESSLIAPESSGSQWAAWNEFNPLFTRDRTTFQAAGMAGSNSTLSDELSVAGLTGRYAYSIGQYHYETDGFRPNNALDKDIADVFVQAALSPRSGIQVEYRQKAVDHGDLTLNGDPDDYSETKQVSRKEKIPRLGVHHAIDARHHLIGSLIFNHTAYHLSQQIDGGAGPFGPVVGVEDREETDDAYNAEGQYLYCCRGLNLVGGAGYYDQETDETASTAVYSGNVRLGGADVDRESEARHGNAYAYAYLTPLTGLDLTLGLGADDLDDGAVEVRQFNPKFGLVWSPTAALTLRGAAFRSLKRSLVSNQTIEPTQIAGFTQFFDDPTATDAKRYGVGVDYRFFANLTGGAEFTFSDMTRPVLDETIGSAVDEDYEEYHHRAFLHWLPHPCLAIGAEYLFDLYQRDPPKGGNTRPYELKTQTLPLTVTAFLTDGFQARIRGTYVNQRVAQRLSQFLPSETRTDDFVLVDVAMGYRLPNRYGLVSLGVANLFDTDFDFQDTNFVTASEQDPVYKPQRHVFFKVALSF